MKATDLMIGDWVLMDMNFSEENPIYTQPDYRHYQIKNGEDINLACETNCLGDADVYLPIPLTPEILEKNFENEGNIFGYKDYKLNQDFTLENRGGRFSLVRKCNDFTSSTFWICDIIYVHELQNALKLCRIEKEIVL